MKAYTYLALGDSYTIGEQVPPEENFPHQAAALLNKTADGADSRRRGFTLAPPKIIAVTGWTTDELDTGINSEQLTGTYDIVSLLIGVNNQYRGRPVSNFKIEFEHLLQRAIQFANNQPQHVFVLSIPDWGVTPFAEGRNRNEIAAAIDAYNKVCETSAAHFNTHYIDITTSQRVDGAQDDFLAADKLHPSGKEYAKWAAKLAAAIKQEWSK